MAEETSANPLGGAGITVSEAATRFESLFSQPQEPEAPQAEEAEAVETDEGQPTEEPDSGEAEAESDVEEPEVAPEPRKFKVKVDGQELEVNEEELTRGYQRDADYRRKTQEVAERNRQLEAQRQQVEATLNQLIPVLSAQVQDKFGQVDWQTLAREDPSQYVALRAEYDAHVQNIQRAVAEQQQIAQANQQQFVENHKKTLESEYKKLTAAIPEFGDAEKGKSIRSDMKTYLVGAGYTEQEINMLSDSRAAIIAHKAMLYDRAQKAREDSKVKQLPKVQKSGTPNKVDPKRTAASEAQNRLRKSGSVNDFADFLYQTRNT